MYKPKKENPASQTSNRQRLPLEQAMPAVKAFKEQFEIAKSRRGVIVEQPWSGPKPEQQYMLMVQWEDGREFPVWTLYEEGGGASKMHWSQTFPPTDIQLMYDVLSMSVESGTPIVIPDELKPASKSSGGMGGGMGSGLGGGMGGGLGMGGGMGGGMPTNPNAGGGMFPGQPGMTPQPQPMPQQQYPQQGYPQPGAYPPQPGYPPPGYPPPGYPAPGGYPPNPYAQPGYPPPAPPPPPPPPPAPAQPQYTAPAADTTNPWLSGSPPSPTTSQNNSPFYSGVAPSSAPVSDDLKPIDYNSMMSKKSNVLLGTLLVEAGLVTSPTLNAALKIQELVREERMDQEAAFDALKRLHGMGASIDEYLSPTDFRSGKSPVRNKPAGAPSGKAPAMDPEKARAHHAAVDLLIKSGILQPADLKTAEGVRAKHGGSIAQILISAKKIDATTFDAALVAIKLIQSNKMKVEQCIIALNYCSRSRVGFDAAIEELGWPDPRK